MFVGYLNKREMKALLTFLVTFILGCIVFSAMFNYFDPIDYPLKKTKVSLRTVDNTPTKPVFGVKVVPQRPNACGWWKIVFTNDGFETQQDIMNTIDLHSWSNPDDVDHGMSFQEELFTSEIEAITVAKQFKSYQKCIEFNEKLKLKYEKLFAKYVEADKVAKKVAIEHKDDCVPHETVIY